MLLPRCFALPISWQFRCFGVREVCWRIVEKRYSETDGFLALRYDSGLMPDIMILWHYSDPVRDANYSYTRGRFLISGTPRGDKVLTSDVEHDIRHPK